ncbi:MAG: hypothetical protein IJN17_03850 [Clostridia bacterium]|nr:hypothetical protein [Oscillospiraceae bacterium]MBQ6702068.1 hypothetical protein [Clostridia bacterium]
MCIAYITVGVLDGTYVPLLKTASLKKIEKPKKKRLKHIRLVGKLDGELATPPVNKGLSDRTAAKIVSKYHKMS